MHAFLSSFQVTGKNHGPATYAIPEPEENRDRSPPVHDKTGMSLNHRRCALTDTCANTRVITSNNFEKHPATTSATHPRKIPDPRHSTPVCGRTKHRA